MALTALTLKQVREIPAFADMSDKDIIDHAKTHGFDTSAMQPEASNDEAGAIRSYGTIPLLKGVADVGGSVGYGLEAAGAKDWGQALQKSSQDVQNTLTARQSQQAQEDAKKTIIDENGNYGGYNLGTLSQDVMGSVPAMAPMAALGAPLAKVATMGSKALGVGDKLAKIASSGALGKGLAAGLDTTIGSGVGFGASEGIYSGASNAAQVQNEIRNTDINKLAEHPIFADTYHNETDPSLPPEERLNQTRDILASKAGDDVFAKTAVRTGLISMATGGGVFGMMRGKATGHSLLAAEDGPLKTAAKGFALEGLGQELPQSAWEQRVQNEAKRDYVDPNQDINEGVLNAGVQGGIAGGVMGLFGGIGGSKARTEVDKKTDDTLDLGNKDQLALPAPSLKIEQNTNRSMPKDTIVFNDGSQISAHEFYQDRLNEHGDEAKARKETYMALNGKPKPVIGIPELVFTADGTSLNKKELIDGFKANGATDQQALDYLSAITKIPVQERTHENLLDTYYALQEKLNVKPTRNPVTKTNTRVTSELNPTDAVADSKSGNADTTASSENTTTDQATTGKLTNDSVSSENQSKPNDATQQSESTLGQRDQQDVGSFNPTHTLNDGTLVKHVENNIYVDKHGEEWQTDDALKLPSTENKAGDLTKNVEKPNETLLNEKIDDQSSQTTNEAKKEESGKESSFVREIGNNGKEESPFVKVTDHNGKAFHVLKTDLAGDQDRMPKFSVISGKRLPTPILRTDINHGSLNSENISEQVQVPANSDVFNSSQSSSTSELQTKESPVLREQLQGKTGADEKMASPIKQSSNTEATESVGNASESSNSSSNDQANTITSEATKQPWEMTSNEYAKQKDQEHETGRIESLANVNKDLATLRNKGNGYDALIAKETAKVEHKIAPDGKFTRFLNGRGYTYGSAHEFVGNQLIKRKKNLESAKRVWANDTSTHIKAIQKAIDEGKTIPKEVTDSLYQHAEKLKYPVKEVVGKKRGKENPKQNNTRIHSNDDTTPEWAKTDEELGLTDGPTWQKSASDIEGHKKQQQYKRQLHAEAIKKAVADGKTVPAKVLIDYPGFVRPDLSDNELDVLVDDTHKIKDSDERLKAIRDWKPKNNENSDTSNPDGDSLTLDATQSQPADSGIQPAVHSQHHKASDDGKSAKQKETSNTLISSPENTTDSEKYHPAIEAYANDLIEGGGSAFTYDEYGKINGRTPSLNPEWFKDGKFQIYKPDGALYASTPSVKEVKQAVNDYKAGKKLKAKQIAILESLHDMAVSDEEQGSYKSDTGLTHTQDMIVDHLERALDNGMLTLNDIEEALDQFDDSIPFDVKGSNISLNDFEDWLGITNEEKRPAQGVTLPEGEILQGYTESELAKHERDQAERARKEAEAELKAKQKAEADKSVDSLADEMLGTYGTNDLFGGNPLANLGQNDTVTSGNVTQKGKVLADKANENIQDVGEKLEGAKKFTYTLKEALSDDVDVSAVPLSKSFPQPDYEKLVESGVSPQTATMVAVMRAEIPTKPQKGYKVKRWSEQVSMIRGFANDLLNNKISVDEVINQARNISNFEYLPDMLKIADQINPSRIKELGNFRLAKRFWGLYEGKKDVTKWEVTAPNIKGNIDYWSKTKHFDTKEDALAYIRDQVTSTKEEGETNEPVLAKFDIWTQRGEEGVFVGKKIATNKFIVLKNLPTLKEARQYVSEHNAELVEQLKEKKQTKDVRRAENNERVGKDYRNGRNVTPLEFGDAFGFRGVQFGNWVNNDRRQQDLNNAYDGLMDLAGVLNIPPKAIGLNGELGLAFGARGSGGVDPAAAHYEPGQVVINLTKMNGAGSLAHEWWHAVDNYFGKQEKSGYLTEAYSGRNPYQVRQEVYQAWTGITEAIKKETQLAKRSAMIDKNRAKDYWSTVMEMTARSFERYVIGKLEDQGYSNDYLANIIPEPVMESEAKIEESDYPFPLQSEMDAVNKAYDKLFNTLKTRETDNGTILFSRSQSTQEAYDNRIDALFNGDTANREGVTVLDNSDMLGMLGYKNLPVKLAEGKVIEGRFNHGLTKEDWKKIPEWLSNPAAVFDSDTVKGSLVFIAPDKVNDAPVRIIVVPNAKQNQLDVHILSNAYDAKGNPPTRSWVHQGLTRYIDTQKSREFLATSGLQLSRVLQNLPGSKTKILTEKNLVKYRAQQNNPLNSKASEPVTNPHTKSTLHDAITKALDKAFGNGWTQRLMDTGKFKIISREEAIKIAGNKAADSKGFYNSNDDTSYFVHDNISKDANSKALAGLVAHEIAVHALHLGKTKEAFKSLLKRFEAMKATNPNVQEAFDRVLADTKAEDKLEEALAYFIENNHNSSLGQKILEAFRQLVRAIGNTLVGKDKFLFSHWANKLTEQELRNMATSALRSAPDSLQFTNEINSGELIQEPRPVERGTTIPSTTQLPHAGGLDKTIPQQDDNSNDNGIKFSRSTPANTDSDNKAIKDIFTKVAGNPSLDWLGGLFTRNQLIDFIAKDVPEMMNYKLLSQAKDNATHQREQQVAVAYDEMSNKIKEAARKPNGWVVDYAKARRMMMELSRVQSMATNLDNFDPAEAKPNQAMTEQEREVYDAYQAMNEAQRAVYIKMRDDYRTDLKATQKALIKNLDRFPIDSQTKAAVIADIKAHFDKALSKGVYFPLARFGKIVVTGINPDGELVTSFVESNGARDKLMAKMEAQGYNQVRSQLKAEYDADVANGNAAHTIAALATNTIENIRDNLVKGQSNKIAGNVNDMLDAFNQELIKALPDSSFRKHFIHRKGTLGESADTLRAYANTRNSTAKGLASIGYDHQIAETLQDGRKAIKALGLRNSDFLDSIMNEFTKREKALKTTSIQPWAQTLTSLGFMGALGFNVASAGVNMLQVAAIGLPELAGRHGFNASSIAISKAYKLLLNPDVLNKSSGFDLMKNPKINAKTKEALQRLHDIGKIDLNQTHDSISAGQNPSYSTNAVTRVFGQVAKKSGYFFHVAEALNRQVMGVAAFELEYTKNGGDYEKALAYTVKAIDDTQFDYGQGNRSRFMMGNTARVLTLFKAYALNTSWYIGRNAALSLSKLPSEERLQARKTLAVTMAMSFATSGLFGMPIGIEAFAGIGGVAGFKYKGASGSVAGAILGMAVFQTLLAGLGADDDDELETEFRNWLTDNFNQTVAEFITKGPARLLPIGDISGRTAMNHLWYQPQNKELEGRDEFNAISNTLMGPVASQIANIFMASKLWADGESGRALEAMTPRAVSNLIAAERLATHGVETIKGDKIVGRDLTVNEIAQKMLGFNPTVIANANDANSAITKERDKLDMEKQHLVKRYLSADAEERTRLFNEDIKDFNEEVPASARITKMSLFRSMKARKGANKHTENGLYLSKKQQYLKKIGRFAEP